MKPYWPFVLFFPFNKVFGQMLCLKIRIIGDCHSSNEKYRGEVEITSISESNQDGKACTFFLVV